MFVGKVPSMNLGAVPTPVGTGHLTPGQTPPPQSAAPLPPPPTLPTPPSACASGHLGFATPKGKGTAPMLSPTVLVGGSAKSSAYRANGSPTPPPSKPRRREESPHSPRGNVTPRANNNEAAAEAVVVDSVMEPATTSK